MSHFGTESSMEDGDRQKETGSAGGAGNHRRRTTNGFHNNNMEELPGDGCGNRQAWNAFADSFSEVQTVLDRNRKLIQQANENHQSRIPDNMKKNVAIIQELNGNITKVASMYSDLSANFSGSVRQQQQPGGGGKGSFKGRNSGNNG